MAQNFPSLSALQGLEACSFFYVAWFLATSDSKTMFLHLCCLGHKVDSVIVSLHRFTWQKAHLFLDSRIELGFCFHFCQSARCLGSGLLPPRDVSVLSLVVAWFFDSQPQFHAGLNLAIFSKMETFPEELLGTSFYSRRWGVVGSKAGVSPSQEGCIPAGKVDNDHTMQRASQEDPGDSTGKG